MRDAERLNKPAENLDAVMIFSHIGHPVIVIDPEFEILYINSVAEEKLRKKGIEKVIGEKCYRVFHNRDVPLESCPCYRMIESAQVETSEVEMEVLGGTYLVSVTPLYKNGELDKIIHLAIDVTEQKEAEKKLKTLYEIGDIIHEIEKGILTSKSVKEIFKTAAGRLSDVLPVECVSAVLFEGDVTKILVSERKNGFNCPSKLVPSENFEQMIKFFEKDKVFLRNRLNSKISFENELIKAGIKSYAVVPIQSDDTICFMILCSSKEDFFSEDTVDMLVEIADSLALAINNLRMREELMESEEMFRALAEKSLVGVDIIQDDVFVYVNPRLAEMVGYSREEFIGESPLKFIHPDDREIFVRNYRERIEGRKKEIRYTLRAIRKDGEVRHIETYGSRIMLRGKPAIVGVSIDITDRIRMQEELKRYAESLERMVEERTRQLVESESRYRSLVESPIVGFWEADADGVFTFVNDRFLEMTGYSRGEVVGRKSIIDFVAPHHRSWIDRRAELLKKGRLPADLFEVELLKKDGSTFHVLVSPCPMYDENGRHVKTVGAMIDITDRVQMERKLRGVLEELEAYAKAISHDLRAPLRGLMGYAEALVNEHSDGLDEEGRKYLERVSLLSSKMDILINDLLEYTKVSEIDKAIERVNMNEIVGYAIDMLEDGIKRRKAKIRITDLPDVKGDRRLLLSIMMNLISNAIKFVERGVTPEVRIYSKVGDKYVRICVEDNGIGVPEEYRERIFHLFERLHGEEVYPGTGVGLAIVKKAVEIMGGGCGVDSGEKGSIFWIELEKWKG